MIPGAGNPPSQLVDDLKRRYSEPHRAYHTWAHIEALLGHCRTCAHLVHRPVPVLWAILWHDAIYDPNRNDNEERSAQLLRSSARDILSAGDSDLSEAMVRATAKHELPLHLNGRDLADCGLFLDLDLSILAAPEASFDRYEKEIRQEYQHVPLPLFRATRAAILRRFLERQSLYFTPELVAKWEAPARANLARSIARLTSSAP